ncbi:4-alpha-glucanotransferase [Gordonia soli]|uniref:4-alpha-glucanotransferase n=1 Tax=Gordonia soli NBRC 108243 TaxID=1223545 RepID=M0QDI3_9ACTN|nr:4-alpha-glucanotransferase [Gordonia soli]GAC66640.1 4-alpha-glucanotransferase [Gordonia soli NBRC 108243]
MSIDDGADADLRALARAHGVATSYVGWDQLDHPVGAETLVAVLGSLGVPATTDDEIAASRRDAELAEWRSFVPPVVVTTEGDVDADVIVHVPEGHPVHVIITTENGVSLTPTQRQVRVEPNDVDGVLLGRATFSVPVDLPPGYHRLSARDPVTDRHAECDLIVTPRRLDTADRLTDRQRWGLAVQLYSIRSQKSWGIGDFGDLGAMAEIAARRHGADFVQINPVHAAQPRPPIEASPYLPTTRRFVNPIYISILDIPEVARLGPRARRRVRKLAKTLAAENTSIRKIKRNKVYRAKLRALELIWSVPLDDAREHEFREYRKAEGRGLRRFATWCALAEEYGTDSPRWSTDFTDRQVVLRERRAHADRVRFFAWLQWICDQQLAAAQDRARAAGMYIGVITDLAVGVDRTGADIWMLGDVLARGATVGAPPDGFNQQGQGWDQPPWHPRRLAEAGYRPYAEMLRTVLRHAGGVRVDHILGLFRLWWIPDGRGPADGTYVDYDHEALIGILALEAQRADAVVIGEDLGVFEPIVQKSLRERGILGTSILWFEHGDDGPIPPEEYRQLCLTSVTTHDLPPTIGYLAGDHIELRSRLGLLETGEEAERARDEADRDAILALARDRGLLSADASPTDPAMVEALYRLIAATPSALLGVALVDGVGERRIQNQPGTGGDQYPNWRIPLADDRGRAVGVEDLATHPRLVSLAAALRDAGVG